MERIDLPDFASGIKNNFGDMTRFAAWSSDEMKRRGYVHTVNFGWVLKADYDKYQFLQKDQGIPAGLKTREIMGEVDVMDKFGNKKKKIKKTTASVLGVGDEYISWQRDCAWREGRIMEFEDELRGSQIQETLEL